MFKPDLTCIRILMAKHDIARHITTCRLGLEISIIQHWPLSSSAARWKEIYLLVRLWVFIFSRKAPCKRKSYETICENIVSRYQTLVASFPRETVFRHRRPKTEFMTGPHRQPSKNLGLDSVSFKAPLHFDFVVLVQASSLVPTWGCNTSGAG